MAEGIARHLGHEAVSAGTHPAHQVSAHALTILSSKGIDTSMLKPKSVDLFDAKDFDLVISMGCGVSCPAMNIDQDWGLDDPVGQSLSVFEQTAQEIERRLMLL
jgi:arsenate reductase